MRVKSGTPKPERGSVRSGTRPSRVSARPSATSRQAHSPTDSEIVALIPRLEKSAAFLTRGRLAEAEDAIQNTLLRVLADRDRYHETRGSLATWANAILRNEIKRGRRSDSRRGAREIVWADSYLEPASASDHAAELAERTGALEAAVDTLPPAERRAVDGLANGRTILQIARAEGITESGVRTRLHRARRRLRRNRPLPD